MYEKRRILYIMKKTFFYEKVFVVEHAGSKAGDLINSACSR